MAATVLSTLSTGMSYITAAGKLFEGAASIVTTSASIKPIIIDPKDLVNISKCALEPFTTVVSLALLAGREGHSKISFENCQLIHNPESAMQGLFRMGAASRDDLVNVPIQELIQVALNWNDPAKTKNPHIKIIFQQCIAGLRKLLDSYPETDKAHGTKFVRDHINGIIGLIAIGLTESTPPIIGGAMKHLYHLEHIRALWNDSLLSTICNLGAIEDYAKIAETELKASAGSPPSESSARTSTASPKIPGDPPEAEVPSTMPLLIEPERTPLTATTVSQIDLATKELRMVTTRHINITNIAIRQLVAFEQINICSDANFKTLSTERSIINFSKYALEPMSTMVQIGSLADLPNGEGTKIGFSSFNIILFPPGRMQAYDRSMAGATRDDLAEVSLENIIATALKWYPPSKDSRFRQIFSRTIAGLEVLLKAYPESDTGGGTQLTRSHIKKLIKMIENSFTMSVDAAPASAEHLDRYHHAEVRGLWNDTDVITLCSLLGIKALKSFPGPAREEADSKRVDEILNGYSKAPRLTISELDLVQGYLKRKVTMHAEITSRAIRALVCFKLINPRDAIA